MLDVIVVGAGPAGSHAALGLAREGHRVTVLEQNPQIGQKTCCTGVISRECASYIGMPQSLAYREVSSARVFSPSRAWLEVKRPDPQALILDRPAFDRWLADEARAAGAIYCLNSKVEQVIASRSGISMLVARGLEKITLEARAAVLASGFNSALVRARGLGQPGYSVGGAQAEVDFPGLEEVEVYLDQSLAPGFFAWAVPTERGRARVGLLGRRGSGALLKSWLAELQSAGRVGARAPLLRQAGIPLQTLRKTYADRLVVVGDAAGQVKPTTGGGIYFGLLCADLAAETLHNCLAVDDLSARSLAAYQKNWQAKLGRELRLERMARRFYAHLDNPRLERVFGRIASSGIVKELLRNSFGSFDWHGDMILRAVKVGIKDEVSGWLRWPRHAKENLERTGI